MQIQTTKLAAGLQGSLCSQHIDGHFQEATESMRLIYVLWRLAK